MSKLTAQKIAEEIIKKISEFEFKTEKADTGEIVSVSDGVAQVSGLRNVSSLEMLRFPKNIFGVAFNLEERQVGAIILGDDKILKEGDKVYTTGKVLSIGVDERLLGRVIDPQGRPLDGKEPIFFQRFYPLEKIAPGVILRQPVDTPLQTGIKAIDSMIPIGRGQRELIIGDRSTGKTALVLDTIINQGRTKSGVVCIYVAIGQRASRIAQVVDVLKREDALKHTIIVAADASSSVSLQYLAPYAGCACGEYFLEKGGDAVVFYDDLTKHAWAYRQISLILRRPSGREAYPGDVFYLHSRLLERACRLDKKYGGGSLTALPIIETQAGDLSSYIPTNVISITDGQIYLESDLFFAGVRPAINVGASVSRVGGAAQVPAMKQVAGRLRLDLAQYRELSSFVQFASELDETTRKQIEQGAKMTELLKQEQFAPLPVSQQVALVWVGTSGLLKEVSLEKIKEFEKEYLSYLSYFGGAVLTKIEEEAKISEMTEKELKKLTVQFLEKWQT